MSNEKINNGTWHPVEDVDLHKRKPEEWAKIYGLKLLNNPSNNLWSEYEWAYNFTELSYYPAHQDFDKISEMEMRAFELRRDLFVGADIGEKEVLKTKYIETQWCLNKLRMF